VLNVCSTLGAYLLGAVMVFTLGYLIVALFTGKRASANPWGSRGFEWRVPSPPPTENFDEPLDPTIGCYDYDRA
jgi:cytochrome c oxidase subunit 1